MCEYYQINQTETPEQIKARYQLQLDYALKNLESKNGIDTILDNLHKAKSMYGNVTINDAIQNLEHLKDGYLC